MIQVMKLSLKEMVNKRIFSLGIVLSMIYLLIYAIGLHYMALGGMRGGDWYAQQVGYQILCLGWYISTFMVGTLAILVGAGSISREIETGTVLSLASKPISRSNILIGKYCAYSLMTICYSIILLASVAFLVRYFFHLALNPLNLLQGLLIFSLFPMLLLAVAHLLSSRLSTIASGAISFMLYAVAIIGGFIEQLGAILSNPGMINIGVISSLLMPSDAVYRMSIYYTGGLLGKGAIAEFGPFGASSIPSNGMLIYAILYVILILGLANAAFNRRDF